MILVMKKRTLTAVILLVVILGAALAWMAGAGVFENTAAKNRLVPIYAVATEEKKVALTFDAAWGADQTRVIMDEVEKYGYKCTFFLTGFWAEANKELVKEIHDRGHQIGNHSQNHKHLNELNSETLQTEIDSVNALINELTGETPRFFRAPFGEYDNDLVKAVGAKGMQCIQWSVDSLDWKGLSGSQITERVIANIEPGFIVLMHNASDHIVEALPLILLSVQNKGMTAVRLDELVYSENYTVDSRGIQIKNT